MTDEARSDGAHVKVLSVCDILAVFVACGIHRGDDLRKDSSVTHCRHSMFWLTSHCCHVSCMFVIVCDVECMLRGCSNAPDELACRMSSEQWSQQATGESSENYGPWLRETPDRGVWLCVGYLPVTSCSPRRRRRCSLLPLFFCGSLAVS